MRLTDYLGRKLLKVNETSTTGPHLITYIGPYAIGARIEVMVGKEGGGFDWKHEGRVVTGYDSGTGRVMYKYPRPTLGAVTAIHSNRDEKATRLYTGIKAAEVSPRAADSSDPFVGLNS